jgi:GAF domain-containing protein
MATIPRLSNHNEDVERRARNARWVSVIVFAALVVAVATTVLQTLSTEAWQLYLLAGVSMGFCLLASLSMAFSRKRPEQAMLILTVGGAITVIAASLALQYVGVPLAFLLVISVVLIAALTLNRAWVFRLILIATIGAFAAILLHYMAPPMQLAVAEARPALLIIYAVLLIPLVVLIVRQFSAFALRTKLILLCIIAALVPLALSLELNYAIAKLAAADPATFMMSFPTVVDNALLTGLGIMLLAAGLAILAARSLVAPLKRLTVVVDKVKSGNFYTDARVEANDEIGTLAVTVNQMTDQLRNIWVGLEQRTADRTRASALNASVSRRLSTVPDQRQLLSEIADLLKEAFNAYHVQICLVDAKRENLVFAGGTGEAGRTMLERGYQIPVGQGPLGVAAETNTVVHIADVTRDQNWLPNPLLPDTKVELAVPIALGDRVLGVIDLHKSAAGAIRQDDIEIIQAIGNQLAIALRNAQSFEKAQQQAAHINVFSDILQKIQAATATDSALQTAASELGAALKGVRVSVRHKSATGTGTLSQPNVDETMAAPITFPISVNGQLAAEFVVEGLTNLNETSGLITAVATQLGLHLEKLRLTGQSQSAVVVAETLSDAAEQFNKADTLDKMLKVAAGPAIRGDANDVLLFIFDNNEEGKPEWLEVRANWVHDGSFALPVGVRLFASSHPAMKLVNVNSLTPVLVNNIANDERLDSGLRQAFSQNNTQATAILPLTQHNNWLGLIVANWNTPHHFNETEAKLLQALTQQATIVTNNLLMQSKTEAAVAETQQLYHASRKITSATTLQEIVSDLAENVPIPAVNRAVLVTLEQPGGPGTITTAQVVSNWHNGRGTLPTAVDTQFKVQVAPDKNIFLRTEPGFFDDAQLDSSIDPSIRAMFAEQKVRGLAILPLWVGGRQLGCLLIEADDPHHFTDVEIRPFTSLAQQMAIVIENRQMIEQTQTALYDADALYQASTLLNTANDSEGVLSGLLQPAINSGASMGGLMMFDLNGTGKPTWATVEAAWARNGASVLPVGTKLNLDEFEVARLWIGDPNTPLYLNDVINDSRLDPAIAEIFTEARARSAMWLPMAVNGRWLGIVYVYWREPREFAASERRLYELLSAQAAALLDKFKLHKQSQKRSEREAVISAIHQKIQSATSVEGAVQIAIREVGDALKARHTVVELAGHRNGNGNGKK